MALLHCSWVLSRQWHPWDPERGEAQSRQSGREVGEYLAVSPALKTTHACSVPSVMSDSLGGPSPRLLSPQAALLPGRGPRPSPS